MADKVVAAGDGVYFVGGQQWQVGSRYKLHKVLGSGSFSSVCSATDTETGEMVALKRIPDVLSNSENAKRVLREVCILRRLEHPHVIALHDVFTTPSSTGRFTYRAGALVSSSLDLYLAMEYADQGDLFHMRGQLAEPEVKAIMRQLLDALRYLHAHGVWHRDIKSANILMTFKHGARHVKVADLGSARSALLENTLAEAAAACGDRTGSSRWRRAGSAANGSSFDGGETPLAAAALQQQQQQQDKDQGGPPIIHHVDSFVLQHSNSSELYARLAAGGTGYVTPLTRMVCTPCYRAPEVVMSRGRYTAAIDMWGLGCVFGELLQRVAWLGKASTPQLQVAPVFALHGAPPTPSDGERFDAPGPKNNVTRHELNALFGVIGSPPWATLASLDSPAWRSYLARMPGRAPSLHRRFGAAGEVAVDLLSRLLEFDPDCRATCEEALAHEYFSSSDAPRGVTFTEDIPTAAHTSSEGGAGGGGGGGTGGASISGGILKRPRSASLFPAPAAAAAASTCVCAGDDGDADVMDVDARASMRPPGAAALLPPLPPAPRGSAQQQQQSSLQAGPEKLSSLPSSPAGAHYYELNDPAAALAALEDEMAALMCSSSLPVDEAPGGPPPGAPQPLRELLEREVADHRSYLARRHAAALTAAADAAVAAAAAIAAGGSPQLLGTAGAAAGSISRQWQHLQPDPGHIMDPSRIGAQRMPHHADAEQARLAPEEHLRAGRHGEWSAQTLQASTRSGAVWGVSLVPTGYSEESHPELAAIIRSQHRR